MNSNEIWKIAQERWQARVAEGHDERVAALERLFKSHTPDPLGVLKKTMPMPSIWDALEEVIAEQDG